MDCQLQRRSPWPIKGSQQLGVSAKLTHMRKIREAVELVMVAIKSYLVGWRNGDKPKS